MVSSSDNLDSSEENSKSFTSSDLLKNIAKYMLFGINAIFWFLGVLSVACGSYTKSQKLEDDRLPLPWLMDPANLFTIVGSFAFILTIIGWIGALRENIIFLKIFSYTIDTLLFLEVLVFIYIMVDKRRVLKQTKVLLQKTIPRYRDDDDLQSIIDYVQQDMKCCGVTGDADWEKNIYFNCKTKGSIEKCGVPFSCCKDSFNKQCGLEMRSGTNKDIKESTIYTQGCVKSAFNHLMGRNHLNVIIGITIGILLSEIFATALGHFIIAYLSRFTTFGVFAPIVQTDE